MPWALTPDDYAALLSTESGQTWSGAKLMWRGQQLHNVQRAFNTLYTGYTRRADRPSPRLEEPAQSGSLRGERLDPQRWEEMFDEYHGPRAGRRPRISVPWAWKK